MPHKKMDISVDKIFLNKNNPRHEHLESQQEAIEYLCKNEKVFNLAKDISAIGLNPAELFILSPSTVVGKYIAREGNRRLCALKLLNDPDLAPNNMRNRFEKLSENYDPINLVSAAVFEGEGSEEEIKTILERTHAGQDDGRGRRQWDAEAKARNTGYDKNWFAVKILDISEHLGFLTTLQRDKRLSVVQRYIQANVFKNKWQLEFTKDTKTITTTRSKNDIMLLLRKFIEDLVANAINTRTGMTVKEIGEYANNLEQTVNGLDSKISAKWSLDILTNPGSSSSGGVGSTDNDETPNPNNPTPPKKLPHDIELENLLRKLGNYKLQQIHVSLYRLHLLNNTCLLTIGIWCFIETLTNLDGRNEDTSFEAYLSTAKLQNLGFDKHETKNSSALITALKRIHRNGNISKHAATAANFESMQLHNDFEVITPLLIKLVESAIEKK